MATLKPTILFLMLAFGASNALGQVKLVQKSPSDTLPMKADSLQAVVVSATLRPHMRGDTLEYNTEHILIRRNALVEDLLRRLPGLQVFPDGTVMYNGEKIQHLLVDGEDIFGADPTMITRTFDASKIARVQILDRKSDQTIFTGIDDGARTKTLNLVMKESAKDGYFGKIEVGDNTNDYYNTNGALAAFRKKEQFTALGLTSNTGILGFTNGAGNAPSSISFLGTNSDALGASAGTGIPRFIAGALHYANSWDETADHFSANYQYSQYFTNPVTAISSLQTQSGEVYGQFQESHSVNEQFQHWGYGTYDWAPNRLAALKFKFLENNIQGRNTYESMGTGAFNDTLANTSQRGIRDNIHQQNVAADISWRTSAARRPEHIFSAKIVLIKSDNVTSGYIFNINHFFLPKGNLQSTDTVDQRKQISDHSFNLSGTLGYSQTLWRDARLGISCGMSYISDQPFQETFDRGNGKFQIEVDSLTGIYRIIRTSEFVLVNLQGKVNHFHYSLVNNLVNNTYLQQDLFTTSLTRLVFIEWAPKILLGYAPNSFTNVSFAYNASTLAPSPSQLLPMKNNNDPLHITEGNPNLKPGFDQTFYLAFHRFKNWMFNFGLTVGLNSNSINTKTITDSLGRQISQPANINGGHNAGFNVSADKKIFGFDAGLNAVGTYSCTFNYVNADLNRNDAISFGGGFKLNKYLADRYFLQLNTNFAYFDQVSSINPGASVRYWSQNHQGSITLFFIRGFDLNTNAVYTWQQRTTAFTGSASVLLWNANISHNFLQDQLTVRLQFNNILNANAGITRTNVANVNTETSTNILGRYWMLSAIYHFDKKFKKKGD